MLLMFAWARLAALIFFLYFGLQPPSFENLIVSTFLQADTLPFLVFGTLIGGVLALLAFAISAVSIPLLLDRPDANVVDAMATSFRTVQTNFLPMLFWAALIVVFTAAGIATLYLGLIVTLPLIGHASWHAYRDLVSFPEPRLSGPATSSDRIRPDGSVDLRRPDGRCSACSGCSWPAARTTRWSISWASCCSASALAFIFYADREAYRPPDQASRPLSRASRPVRGEGPGLDCPGPPSRVMIRSDRQRRRSDTIWDGVSGASPAAWRSASAGKSARPRPRPSRSRPSS